MKTSIRTTNRGQTNKRCKGRSNTIIEEQNPMQRLISIEIQNIVQIVQNLLNLFLIKSIQDSTTKQNQIQIQ